jgi:hypothetical protein
MAIPSANTTTINQFVKIKTLNFCSVREREFIQESGGEEQCKGDGVVREFCTWLTVAASI